MSYLALLLILAFIGLVAWALVTYIPMPQGIKTVIVIVAVVCSILYALHAFGFHVPNPSVPQLR